MLSKENFATLLVLVLLFQQNSAGLFRRFENFESLPEHYIQQRNKSLYRGLLLSLSVVERKELCRDIFTTHYYRDQQIEFGGDDERVLQSIAERKLIDGRPLYSIVLRELALSRTSRIIVDTEIFCECVAKKLRSNRAPLPLMYYVSFAFETNGFHTSEVDYKQVVSLKDYISLSPEHVSYDQAQLEEFYMSIRRTIEELRDESPELVDMIEDQDDISALSSDEAVHLCASILSTPVFTEENLEFSIDWAENSNEVKKFRGQKLHLVFENYEKGNLATDNLECRAFDFVANEEITVYLTRSYNNESSLFVLKISDGVIELDKYFRKIPALMNLERKSVPNSGESSRIYEFST